MKDSNVVELCKSRNEFQDHLTMLLQEGAQRMLTQAVDAEVDALMANFSGERNAHGFQRLVRNGYLPEREIQTGVGPVKVKMPRVRDKGDVPPETDPSY
jgi:putative transposase